MNDLAWCLADPHLVGRGGDTAAFDAWARAAAASKPQRIIILGDLFEGWIGRVDVLGGEERRVLERISWLSERISTTFIVGNRDYFPQWFLKSPIRVVDQVQEEWSGLGMVHVEHGDCVNREDLNYLYWRRLSRSFVAGWVWKHLPARMLLKVKSRLGNRLATTNRDYRLALPVAWLRAKGNLLGRKGVKLGLIGHFHVHREIRAGAGKLVIVPRFEILNSLFLRVTSEGGVQVDSLPPSN